jgi:predicted NAD/FAD-binding protein
MARLSIEALTSSIPNRQIGVTTVGAIRRLGGTVTLMPSGNNRFHCVLVGITPDEAAGLFTPVIANPNR